MARCGACGKQLKGAEWIEHKNTCVVMNDLTAMIDTVYKATGISTVGHSLHAEEISEVLTDIDNDTHAQEGIMPDEELNSFTPDERARVDAYNKAMSREHQPGDTYIFFGVECIHHLKGNV